MTKPLGDSVVVEQPRVESKVKQYTTGFRKRTSSKTIGAAIAKLLADTKRFWPTKSKAAV